MRNRTAFLSVVAAMGVISASLCAPALPFIADHFSANLSIVQCTISLFLVGNAFGQFLSGPLSDTLGQRRVLLGGLLLYSLASCTSALANEMSLLLGARFFQGMGSATGPVLARAIAASTFPPEKSAQVQSYGSMGIGIASMVAMLAAGPLTLISWRGNFWLATGFGVLLFLWATRAIANAPVVEASSCALRAFRTNVREVWRHPQFLQGALCHAMTYGAMYGYIALFPFLLIEFFHEKNPTQVSLYSACMIACYLLGSFFASRLAIRGSLQRLIVIAIFLQLASGIWLACSGSPSLAITALLLFNVSIGIILPLTSARALTPFAGHAVGTASSSLGLLYRLIGALLSTLICQFPLAGGAYLGYAIALLSVVSLLVPGYSARKQIFSLAK